MTSAQRQMFNPTRFLCASDSQDCPVVRNLTVRNKVLYIIDTCPDKVFSREMASFSDETRKTFRAVLNIRVISCFRYSICVEEKRFTFSQLEFR